MDELAVEQELPRALRSAPDRSLGELADVVGVLLASESHASST